MKQFFIVLAIRIYLINSAQFSNKRNVHKVKNTKKIMIKSNIKSKKIRKKLTPAPKVSSDILNLMGAKQIQKTILAVFGIKSVNGLINSSIELALNDILQLNDVPVSVQVDDEVENCDFNQSAEDENGLKNAIRNCVKFQLSGALKPMKKKQLTLEAINFELDEEESHFIPGDIRQSDPSTKKLKLDSPCKSNDCVGLKLRINLDIALSGEHRKVLKWYQKFSNKVKMKLNQKFNAHFKLVESATIEDVYFLVSGNDDPDIAKPSVETTIYLSVLESHNIFMHMAKFNFDIMINKKRTTSSDNSAIPDSIKQKEQWPNLTKIMEAIISKILKQTFNHKLNSLVSDMKVLDKSLTNNSSGELMDGLGVFFRSIGQFENSRAMKIKLEIQKTPNEQIPEQIVRGIEEDDLPHDNRMMFLLNGQSLWDLLDMFFLSKFVNELIMDQIKLYNADFVIESNLVLEPLNGNDSKIEFQNTSIEDTCGVKILVQLSKGKNSCKQTDCKQAYLNLDVMLQLENNELKPGINDLNLQFHTANEGWGKWLLKTAVNTTISGVSTTLDKTGMSNKLADQLMATQTFLDHKFTFQRVSNQMETAMKIEVSIDKIVKIDIPYDVNEIPKFNNKK